jgi:hypothetical protein
MGHEVISKEISGREEHLSQGSAPGRHGSGTFIYAREIKEKRAHASLGELEAEDIEKELVGYGRQEVGLTGILCLER